MPLSDILSTVDPNLVYLGLLVSLWSVVTIVYTPGTIIGETLSAVFTLATLAVLVNMPTNWPAVLLVALGVAGFLALPFLSLRWARFADLGLVLQAIGGLLLFRDGLVVSPAIILVTIIMAWAYHRLVLMPVLRRHIAAGSADEIAQLVGGRGRVTTLIDPVGTIYINGETWTARSEEPITVGTEVLVTDKVGLELRVEKAKRDEQAANAALN
jgi:membrane-bound serine protease (ClpP class)